MSTSYTILCPICHSSLDDTQCPCGTTRRTQAGIIKAINVDDKKLSSSELEIQNNLSEGYELNRYKRSFSRYYYKQIFSKIIKAVDGAQLILDNGCGNGAFYEIVEDFPKNDQEIVGLDLSLDMLKFAEKRIQTVIQGDSENLPFEEETFDAVICKGLIHHLPDPNKGLLEIRRVLKPSGKAIFYEPHKNPLSLLPRYFANKTSYFDEDHRSFTDNELQELLKRHFKISSFEYSGYVAYPLMAFPDLIDFSKFLPINLLKRFLVKLDNCIAKLPLVRKLSWAMLVEVEKDA